jgi:hypothetical protein
MLLVDVSLLYLLFIVVRRLVATIALFCSIRLFRPNQFVLISIEKKRIE